MRRVGIVGAGLSGLIAARRLTRRGFDVVVLEASDRVGGRMLDHRAASGDVYALGADWLGPHERRLPALLAELGLTTTPQVSAGRGILELSGARWVFEPDPRSPVGFMPLPSAVLSDTLLGFFARLDAMCEQVPLDAPHTAPDAEAWDALSLAAWLVADVDDVQARAVFTAIAEVEMGAPLGAISLLYYLSMRRAIHRDIVDDRRIRGGAEQICQRLASALGDAVRTGARVVDIEQAPSAGSVVLKTTHDTLRVDYAIVTTPPGPAMQLTYTPPLPADRRALVSAMTLARLVKCIVVYPRPFWRARGLSGRLLSDIGPLRLIDDCSPHDGVRGALVGFARRDPNRPPPVAGALEAAVLDQLTAAFGPEAARPIEYVKHDWTTQPHAGGAYFPNLPPGVLARWGGALRRPFGCIHWAGTETARRWTGSMEGAILAGERAADEIIARTEPSW